MTPRTFGTPTLYVEHQPDSTSELDANGVKQHSELPGFLEIGVLVDGVKVALHSLKAGSLLPKIDAARAKAASASDDAPAAQ